MYKNSILETRKLCKKKLKKDKPEAILVTWEESRKDVVRNAENRAA